MIRPEASAEASWKFLVIERARARDPRGLASERSSIECICGDDNITSDMTTYKSKPSLLHESNPENP